jgi:hypothetical protein
VRLTGRFGPGDHRHCILYHHKVGCCPADAVLITTPVVVDSRSPARLDPDRLCGQWVQVTGRVHFFNRPGTNEYFTALVLYPTEEQPLDELMKVVPPPPDHYLWS